MSRWTLVPLRGLASGKSRLAGLLDEGQRIALNTLLLHRVLAAVAAAEGDLKRCIVAAGAEDAARLARRYGAQVLLEEQPCDLNAAMEAARQRAIACGASSVLALVADLPHATGAALSRLAAVPPRRAAVIADKQGVGTTGLLLPADCGLEFMFGPNSLTRHVCGLRALQLEPVLWEDAALTFDLDTPEDYLRWRSASPRPQPSLTGAPAPQTWRMSPQP